MYSFPLFFFPFYPLGLCSCGSLLKKMSGSNVSVVMMFNGVFELKGMIEKNTERVASAEQVATDNAEAL